MLKLGFVPDEFGQGILVPLIKDSSGDKTKCDNYRCITLSPMFSKVFEYCLLDKYSNYFNTSDLQFGFKQM